MTVTKWLFFHLSLEDKRLAVHVQTEDFDAGLMLKQLSQISKGVGAVVSFVGYVRDLSEQKQISTLSLEHYPGMTEKSLEAIVSQAKQRWQVIEAVVVHRVGTLAPNEQIVLVAVASAHRQDAFSACEFIMDYLKTDAPFWKKESTENGEHWVEAKASDDLAKARW